MNTDVDPLRQIADSLTKLENLYAEQLRRTEERSKIFDEKQKGFDERQKKWDERDKIMELWKNPWLLPGQLSQLLQAIALAILAIAVFILARR
ncbi:MAG: hypothetical protein HY040_23315 [Planctomycetes bacterium]|nr:hypothetical protein [Planctomycetota bacterium]